jgi:hypothetical protein
MTTNPLCDAGLNIHAQQKETTVRFVCRKIQSDEYAAALAQHITNNPEKLICQLCSEPKTPKHIFMTKTYEQTS